MHVRHRWSGYRHEHARWQELQGVAPGDFVPVSTADVPPCWAEVRWVEEASRGVRVGVDVGVAASDLRHEVNLERRAAEGREQVFWFGSNHFGYVADRPLAVPDRAAALARLARFGVRLVRPQAWWADPRDSVGWVDGPGVNAVLSGPEWVFTPVTRFVTMSALVSHWLDWMDEDPAAHHEPPDGDTPMLLRRPPGEAGLVELAVALAGDAIIPDPFPRVTAWTVWQGLSATLRLDRAALSSLVLTPRPR